MIRCKIFDLNTTIHSNFGEIIPCLGMLVYSTVQSVLSRLGCYLTEVDSDRNLLFSKI